MTDKNFKFGKGIWDILIANDIAYSTNGELTLSVSEWQNVPTLVKTAIIATTLSYGFNEED